MNIQPAIPQAATLQTVLSKLEQGDTGWAWSATTNRGGLNAAGRTAVHRVLRKLGYVYFLAVYSETEKNNACAVWGICTAAEFEQKEKDQEISHVVSGYTIDHAAHKLGDGCAKRGWELYFSVR